MITLNRKPTDKYLKLLNNYEKKFSDINLSVVKESITLDKLNQMMLKAIE